MNLVELPLFPLHSVLLPGGRLTLQIFEPRYLDLVSRSLRSDSGFGIVYITDGHEVIRAQGGQPPVTVTVGTLARIVDWDAMPQALLRITVEGSRRFRVHGGHVEGDLLMVGDVEWLDELPAAPIGGDSLYLQEILSGLAAHPALRRLNVSAEVADCGALAYALAQYLPLGEEDRYALLAEDKPDERIAYISRMVQHLGGP